MDWIEPSLYSEVFLDHIYNWHDHVISSDSANHIVDQIVYIMH
jgi:hypothetical protein